MPHRRAALRALAFLCVDLRRASVRRQLRVGWRVFVRIAVPLLYNDPEHWRTRAQEVRELARKMTDSEGKGSMLGIAENYDRLAARAIERLSEGPPRH
jgi:hypothetical protein